MEKNHPPLVDRVRGAGSVDIREVRLSDAVELGQYPAEAVLSVRLSSARPGSEPMGEPAHPEHVLTLLPRRVAGDQQVGTLAVRRCQPERVEHAQVARVAERRPPVGERAMAGHQDVEPVAPDHMVALRRVDVERRHLVAVDQQQLAVRVVGEPERVVLAVDVLHHGTRHPRVPVGRDPHPEGAAVHPVEDELDGADECQRVRAVLAAAERDHDQVALQLRPVRQLGLELAGAAQRGRQVRGRHRRSEPGEHPVASPVHVIGRDPVRFVGCHPASLRLGCVPTRSEGAGLLR
jgi:hypothetical protein